MTVSDYRAFAECPLTVLSTGTVTAETTGQNGSVSKGFLHIICLADASLTGVTFLYPKAGTTPDTAIALKAGAQLAGVKAATIASGQVQVLYFI